MRLPVSGATILLAALAATALRADPVDVVLAAAAAECAAFENGSFTALPDAVARLDLTGDGVLDDAVVDATYFQCSTAASLYGGSGGTYLTLIAGGQASTHLAQAWQVIDWVGAKVVLLFHSGTACGGFGAQPCVEALVWGGEGFLTVRPTPE
jgi:hypothetical protein